jgi:hypothetical protein
MYNEISEKNTTAACSGRYQETMKILCQELQNSCSKNFRKVRTLPGLAGEYCSKIIRKIQNQEKK